MALDWRCNSRACHPVLPCVGRNRHLPQLDDIAWYSATRCDAAKLVVRRIADYCCPPSSARSTWANTTVWDAFGGSGADAIAFLLSGVKRVTVTELEPSRADAILQRLQAYNVESRSRVITGDSTLQMEDADIVYVDPPWGGPGYKLHAAVKIRLGGKNLGAYMAAFRRHARTLLVLKLPYNYDYAGDPRVLPKAARRYHVKREGKENPDFDVVLVPGHCRSCPSQLCGKKCKRVIRSGPYMLYAAE
jgi:RNA cap guanine-N2 methyltransferase